MIYEHNLFQFADQTVQRIELRTFNLPRNPFSIILSLSPVLSLVEGPPCRKGRETHSQFRKRAQDFLIRRDQGRI